MNKKLKRLNKILRVRDYVLKAYGTHFSGMRMSNAQQIAMKVAKENVR